MHENEGEGSGAWLARPSTRAPSTHPLLPGRHARRAAEEKSARIVRRAGAKTVLTDKVVDIGSILAPVEPPVIYAVGLNYKAHAEEAGLDLPVLPGTVSERVGAPADCRRIDCASATKPIACSLCPRTVTNRLRSFVRSFARLPRTSVPVVFIKATSSVVGHQDAIIIPACARNPPEVDYEAELAVIIGRECRNVPKEMALDFVLGYTIANDVGARRWQGRKGGGQWSRAKSFDTFCPLGPFLVPKSRVRPHSHEAAAASRRDRANRGPTSSFVLRAYRSFSSTTLRRCPTRRTCASRCV